MSAITLDTAIGALSVTATLPDGSTKALTIKTITTLPSVDYSRDCPILHPDQTNWLGQQSATPGNFDNVIAGRIQNTITLNYRLLYEQAGAGRGLADFYANMAALSLSLRQKIFGIDLPAMSIRQVSISQFGPITDPVGKSFYGSLVTVTALEYEGRS